VTSGDRQSVDIVMPFHRNDRFLVEAVSSIMSSNGVRIRLILIDDRKDDSSDLTFNADKFEIVKSHGVGYSRALRLGLEMVKSEYFALLDSDDLSHKDRLARELDLMHRENLDIVACSMKKIGKSSVSKITQPLIFRDIGILRESNLLGSINSNSTWMCKTDLLNEQNFLSSKFISLDWATTLQLNPKTKVGFIDSRLYSYRQHESQMTKNIQYKNQAFFEIYPLWA